MKKSELKQIIRECLKEALFESAKQLSEARRVSYFGLKHGELEQYALRKLQNDAELPPRIDYQPRVMPKTIRGPGRWDDAKVDPNHQKEVERQALEDLETIKVDGVPLTQLYNWKVEVSGHNPHGWGVPQWRYYVVGTRKSDVKEGQGLGGNFAKAQAAYDAMEPPGDSCEEVGHDWKFVRSSGDVAEYRCRVCGKREVV